MFTFCGKRYFTGAPKAKLLRWKDEPGLSRWAQYQPKKPYKREVGGPELERDDMTDAEVTG